MRVDEVCSHALHHVSATCTLREAAQLMRDRRAKLLFVTEEDGPYQRILGVVTDRDMVVHGLADLPACGEALITCVMTPGVVTTERHAAVSDALRSMLAHRVRRLAVRDGESAVIGLLTLDDAVRSLSAEVDMVSNVLRRERSENGLAGEVAAAPVFRL